MELQKDKCRQSCRTSLSQNVSVGRAGNLALTRPRGLSSGFNWGGSYGCTSSWPSKSNKAKTEKVGFLVSRGKEIPFKSPPCCFTGQPHFDYQWIKCTSLSSWRRSLRIIAHIPCSQHHHAAFYTTFFLVSIKNLYVSFGWAHSAGNYCSLL